MIHLSKSFIEFLYKRFDDNVVCRLLIRAYERKFGNTLYQAGWYGYSGNDLYRGHWTSQKYTYFNVYKLMFTDKELNYLTIRTDGTLSYLPAGKEHQVNERGDWSREGRQQGKPAKVIRKLFTKNALKVIPEKEFENFATFYKSDYSSEGMVFKLKENKQISEVYCMPRVNSGTLGDSCMNGDDDYLEMYNKNPNLKILILLDANGQLNGRCLVWKVKIGDEEVTFADRIYVAKEHHFDMFLQEIEKRGWWRKRDYRTYDNKPYWINPDGEEREITARIECDTDFDYYPYIDTFSYGGEGYITNHSSGTYYTYNNTDGTRDGESDEHEGEVWDDIDEEYIDEEYAVYIERGRRRGSYTHSENTEEVNGYVYWRDDEAITFLDSREEYVLVEDVVYSEHEGRDLHIEDSVRVEGDWMPDDSDEIVEINGDWYFKDSDEVVEVEDKYYLKDECIEVDGVYYPEGSEAIVEVEGEWILKTTN